MQAPFNFMKWVEDNRDKLKPPVCNRTVFKDGDFIIMAIGGPNTRKDYHDDPGEEFFYQIEGDMTLRVMEGGRPRDIEIREGEMFLLPAHMHHSPQRKANTVGLVVERKRAADERDGFLWYCDKCHKKLYEEFLPLKSIVKDLPPLFDRFWSNEESRTCKSCGHVMPLPEGR
ncbi:MAG: 3-hydroxyanthranilate 3,4-dioxygenase, partial [Alphaproteobacteria bacterium]|nr:3-hydroxyanthranilate 3,4-dioxygenase [Alphaproteobacteria bacterium]